MDREDAALPLLAAAGLGLFAGGLKLKSMHEAGTPMWQLVGIVVAGIAILSGAGYLAWTFIPRSSAEAKMRDVSRVDDMIGRGAAERGLGLRASLSTTKGVEMKQLAVAVGRVGKKVLHKSYEDFTIVFMGPRSNKTSAVAVPRILSAPGAVVTTSNKPDLWILTAGLREQVGPVYAFDPGNIAYVPQSWWWNILGHLTEVEHAVALADEFVEESGGGASSNADPFFTPTGRNLLAWTMFAAAIDEKRSMRDVFDWLATYSTEPVTILEAHGETRAALAYAALTEMPNDTKGGVYGQANTAMGCFQSERLLRWVTPPHTWKVHHEGAAPIEEIDLWSLYAYEDGKAPTLYLLSQEGTASAGPVLAALVNRIFEIGDLAASASGGRVDPPITIVLDECANICRIKNLPKLASHLGSKSICVDAIFQSEAQVQGVWGIEGARALWGAATVRICGAGLQDPEFAKKLSDLVGDHKVKEKNHSYGRGGGSTSEHWVREPIMPAADIAAMSKKNALLIRQESKPILMDLMPWYKEPDSGNIVAVKDIATAQVQQSAIAALGADNAVARALLTRQQAAADAEAR